MAAVELFEGGAFLVDGRTLVAADEAQAFSEQTGRVLDAQEARTQTMAGLTRQTRRCPTGSRAARSNASWTASKA